jgi:uncharacterized protein YcfJ
MKKANILLSIACSVGLGTSLAVHAQEVGRVISSTPMIQQVAVPRQVCSTQPVVQQPQKSGAGALMGAIAGGAVGNAMGKGSGNAILGDKIEGNPQAEVRNVQTCNTQMFYENRTTGYNVVYEFNGKQYTVVMPSDPGPTVRLQVTPVAPIGPTPVATPLAVPPPGSAPQS